MAASSGKRSDDVVPRAKVWLERNGRYVFGLGISNILKAVARTGSIKQAANEVGKSYRHVWSRIKQVERDLGEALVETKVGGHDPHRSELTDTARQLIARFDDLRDRVFEQVQHEFEHSAK